ncbi:hypothetical protein COK81_16045 [Bacillus thuringiensis]|uniref:Uncharacterized protein n=1 Tax=Bacillus thuringiensis TaxID=1428 RepID=A0A9X7G1G4_BACTU|nr:hypothetical protein [Bacillus thuringiensis]PFT90519.1 hypothetical protein COK81_16045 [Bacillus thuringiensis]
MHVDMWIPYGEVKTYFARKKGKWYRKLENEFEDRRTKKSCTEGRNGNLVYIVGIFISFS